MPAIMFAMPCPFGRATAQCCHLLPLPEGHNLAGRRVHKAFDVEAPGIKGLPPLGEVLCSVVGARYSRQMAADVVHDCLDDVWLREPAFVDVSYKGAPQIMYSPRRHRLLYADLCARCCNARIQLCLRFGPTREAPGPAPEH